MMYLFKNFILQHLDNLLCFRFYQRCSGLTLKPILRKYFKPHAKIMNDVLVRDFVKTHYQFSAKVMDPNFIRRVAKEIEFK